MSAASHLLTITTVTLERHDWFGGAFVADRATNATAGEWNVHIHILPTHLRFSIGVSNFRWFSYDFTRFSVVGFSACSLPSIMAWQLVVIVISLVAPRLIAHPRMTVVDPQQLESVHGGARRVQPENTKCANIALPTAAAARAS